MFGKSQLKPMVVRDYGRDSLLVWANLLLAPLLAHSGYEPATVSEDRLAANIEADAAAMRKKGYLVTSTQTPPSR